MARTVELDTKRILRNRLFAPVLILVISTALAFAAYASWTAQHTATITSGAAAVPPTLTLSATFTPGVTGFAQGSPGFTTGAASTGSVQFTNSTSDIRSVNVGILHATSCPSTQPTATAAEPVLIGGLTGSSATGFNFPAGTGYIYCFYYSAGAVPGGTITVRYSGTTP